MPKDSKKRYPVKRHQYTQSVGKLLVHRISQIFQELDFKTWVNPGQSNGADLRVYNNNSDMVLIAEILNWSIGSMLSEKRVMWIVDNLLGYSCEKVVIYTRFENDYRLADLCRYDIYPIEIGYQLLPKRFYEFYYEHGLVICRKADSRNTKQDIKATILDYMRSSNFEIGVSDFENCELIVANM